MHVMKKVGGSIAAAALMLSAFAPAAFAETTIDISDNGSGSHNSVSVSNSSSTSVSQTSNTSVGASVNSSASTGGNTANGNTGGDVSIDTGNATAKSSVIVVGGNNTASVDSCGCPTGDVDATISDNGSNSHNTIKSKTSSKTTVKQRANVWVEAWVSSSAKTGKNKANDNTGGNVSITTDWAKSTSKVIVIGGSNTLNP